MHLSRRVHDPEVLLDGILTAIVARVVVAGLEKLARKMSLLGRYRWTRLWTILLLSILLGHAVSRPLERWMGRKMGPFFSIYLSIVSFSILWHFRSWLTL